MMQAHGSRASSAGDDALSEDDDTDSGLEASQSADQLRAEIKLWEAMQSTELPLVHYCRTESLETIKNKNSQLAKGPSALEQLKDGTVLHVHTCTLAHSIL